MALPVFPVRRTVQVSTRRLAVRLSDLGTGVLVGAGALEEGAPARAKAGRADQRIGVRSKPLNRREEQRANADDHPAAHGNDGRLVVSGGIS
ncbi:MAG: hypothetical protein MZV64_23005 [Ignavibacteriales bacterium]|nr:hypothetical protein [Ignavibacteriales bacterium]